MRAKRTESLCTLEFRNPIGSVNAVRHALANEEGLHAVQMLLQRPLLECGRCGNALLYLLRTFATSRTHTGQVAHRHTVFG